MKIFLEEIGILSSINKSLIRNLLVKEAYSITEDRYKASNLHLKSLKVLIEDKVTRLPYIANISYHVDSPHILVLTMNSYVKTILTNYKYHKLLSSILVNYIPEKVLLFIINIVMPTLSHKASCSGNIRLVDVYNAINLPESLRSYGALNDHVLKLAVEFMEGNELGRLTITKVKAKGIRRIQGIVLEGRIYDLAKKTR